MIRRLLLCLAFGLLVVSPLALHAQDDDPFADLDPDAIFAEGVEVVGVRYDATLPEQMLYYSADPRVVIDDAARVVHVHNSETGMWDDFPYSADMETLQNPQVRQDGTILFNQPPVFYDPDTDPPLDTWPERWLLNPVNAEFSQPELVCGIYARALIGTGSWVRYTDPIVNRTSLCNTETGEFAGLNLWHQLGDVFYVKGVSPDGQWLLIKIGDPNYISSHQFYRYYGYRLVDGELNFLGEHQQGTDPGFIRWINNTNVLMHRGFTGQPVVDELYIADVSRPESYTYLMPGQADYLEDPPRYEYLQSYWEVASRTDPSRLDYPVCKALVIYVGSQVLEEYQFGRDCFGRVERRRSSYFYVSYSNDERSFALYEYDVTNKTTSVLFLDRRLYGLDSVSPDGRYALLVMGATQSQNRDFLEGEMSPFDPVLYGSWMGLPTRRLAIYDLLEGQVVSELRNAVGYPEWLNQSEFVLRDDRSEFRQLRVIFVNHPRLSEVHIPAGNDSESPNGEFILFGRYLCYIVPVGRIVPVIQQDFEIPYRMQVEWTNDNLLEVTFSKPHRYFEDNPSYSETITYTIRIPTPEGDPDVLP
jgi:hypothetical protein